MTPPLNLKLKLLLLLLNVAADDELMLCCKKSVKSFLTFFVFSLATPALAQTSLVTQRSPSLLGRSAQFEIATGFCSFSNIPLPSAESLITDEGEQPTYRHMGIPAQFKGRIGQRWTHASLFLTVDALHASSLVADRGAYDVSFERLSLGLGPSWHWDRTSRDGVSLQLKAQRNRFLSISSGHYVDALIPTAALQMGTFNRSFDLQAHIGYAVQATLGYNNGSTSSKIASAQTQLWRAGVNNAFRMTPTTRFNIGVDLEHMDIAIGDTSQYNDFGLVVPLQYPREQRLSLNTWTILFGAEKTLR